MIPAVIHSVWLGPLPLPERHKAWMEGWRAAHPEFEFVHWTEDTVEERNEAIDVALRLKRWARAADIVRLQVLRRYGGIYLDTDVEIVRSLAPLRKERCFFGFSNGRRVDYWVNNAVIGAVPGHDFIGRALAETIAPDPVVADGPAYGPGIITDLLDQMAPLGEDGERERRIGDVLVTPSRYFYPYALDEACHPGCVAPDTYCIHHWSLSWHAGIGLKRRIKQLPETFPALAPAVDLLRWAWPRTKVLRAIPLAAVDRLRLMTRRRDAAR